MTKTFVIPEDEYIADGILTDFAGNWPILNEGVITVYVDDILQVLTTDYTILPGWGEDGGIVRFNVAPANLAVVLIKRQTPITQDVDFVAFEAFPADVVEGVFDKMTMIMQECCLTEQTGASLVLSFNGRVGHVIADCDDYDTCYGSL